MKTGRICTGLILIWLVFVPFVGGGMAAQPQPMIAPHAQAMSLLPFLDYLIDESMAMDIEEVAGLNQGWQPFIADRLPQVEGMLWLRFTIAPLAQDDRPKTYLLDMGQGVPGQPILYDPIQNELSGAREWRENVPAQRNILLLPEAGAEAAPCYIRLEGLPGPWFAPMIRTPQNAASNWDSLARTGAILALAVVMLLCIIRGMSEKGQWRYWTALFVAFSLAQAILGMPRETQHFGMLDLAATLCPGLALMCLPHAGRHLMSARVESRSIDIQLFLLSLPGAALALLPLAPGWNWLDRWVDLWPLGAVLFIPTALGAWIMHLPGSRRFLLACVVPPLFVGIAMVGMEFGVSSSLLASGPIWGVALAALLLAATRAPQGAMGLEGEDGRSPKKSAAKKKSGKKLPQLAIDQQGDEVIALEHPLDDPNLRLIQIEQPQSGLPAPDEVEVAEPIPRRSVSSIAMQADEARENALREPVDAILRELAALRQCALPPSAREATAGLTTAAQRLATILSNPEILEDDGEAEAAPTTFNLQKIVRNAHDSVAAIAECSGIALSWYLPPHLPQLYYGDGRRLESALRLLLESSVRCSRHGAIKVTARQVPGSQENGHLLFTVSDDGEGYPPYDRSSVALAKAWELTGIHGGYLSVEASPEGTTIAFTAHFKAQEQDEESGIRQVILASDDADARRQLMRVVESIPCQVKEAATSGEILNLQAQRHASVLIAQGRFARPAAGDIVREFCRMAREAGQKKCFVLAITQDDSQWGLLKTSGFTHAMLDPVDPEVLRRTMAKLLDIDIPADVPFHLEGAVLPDQPIHADDKVPTMLIEQDFSLKAGFEGPDWLGEEEEPLLEQDKARGGVARGEQTHAQMQQQAAQQAQEQPRPQVQKAARQPMQTSGQAQRPVNHIEPVRGNTPQQNFHAGSQAEVPPGDGQQVYEGAPQQIQQEIPRSVPQQARQPEQAQITLQRVAEEPLATGHGGRLKIDVPPMTLEGNAPEADPKDIATDAPLTDFIVGVENHAPEDEGSRNKFKNFLEGSASAVRSALSELRKPSPAKDQTRQDSPVASPQIEAEPEQAQPGQDPVVVNLLATMETLMEEAQASYVAKNCAGVAEATAQLVTESERFGLRILTRMAQCVERAAHAQDMGALNDLLPELSNAVERTRILILQKQPGNARK